jgi:hypothetical protein
MSCYVAPALGARSLADRKTAILRTSRSGGTARRSSKRTPAAARAAFRCVPGAGSRPGADRLQVELRPPAALAGAGVVGLDNCGIRWDRNARRGDGAAPADRAGRRPAPGLTGGQISAGSLPTSAEDPARPHAGKAPGNQGGAAATNAPDYPVVREEPSFMVLPVVWAPRSRPGLGTIEASAT